MLWLCSLNYNLEPTKFSKTNITGTRNLIDKTGNHNGQIFAMIIHIESKAIKSDSIKKNLIKTKRTILEGTVGVLATRLEPFLDQTFKY